MDRTLKVYANTGHLFATFEFNYDEPRQAIAHYTEYRRLYRDDEEDENKSVYPGGDTDMRLDFRKFNSIDEIKAYDKDVVKKALGREMKDPNSYNYTYDEQPVSMRYLVGEDRHFQGMINVMFSFIDNTKEVKFLSANGPRFDYDITSDSLETNLECIQRIPVYSERSEPREIHYRDLKRLPVWY